MSCRRRPSRPARILNSGRGDAYCGMLNCWYAGQPQAARRKRLYPRVPGGHGKRGSPQDDRRLGPGRPRRTWGCKGAQGHRLRPAPQRLCGLQRPHQAPVRYGRRRSRRTPSWTCWSSLRRAHAGDPAHPRSHGRHGAANWARATRCPASCPGLAQYEADAARHRAAGPQGHASEYVAFANKCWPAFQTEFELRALLRQQPPGFPPDARVLRGGHLRRG